MNHSEKASMAEEERGVTTIITLSHKPFADEAGNEWGECAWQDEAISLLGRVDCPEPYSVSVTQKDDSATDTLLINPANRLHLTAQPKWEDAFCAGELTLAQLTLVADTITAALPDSVLCEIITDPLGRGDDTIGYIGRIAGQDAPFGDDVSNISADVARGWLDALHRDGFTQEINLNAVLDKAYPPLPKGVSGLDTELREQPETLGLEWEKNGARMTSTSYRETGEGWAVYPVIDYDPTVYRAAYHSMPGPDNQVAFSTLDEAIAFCENHSVRYVGRETIYVPKSAPFTRTDDRKDEVRLETDDMPEGLYNLLHEEFNKQGGKQGETLSHWELKAYYEQKAAE